MNIFEEAMRLVWGTMALGLAVGIMFFLLAGLWILLTTHGFTGVLAAIGVLVFLTLGYLTGRAALS